MIGPFNTLATAINATITDSIVFRNGDTGIRASGLGVAVTITRSTIFANNVGVENNSATVRLGQNTIIGTWSARFGNVIQSYGDNPILGGPRAGSSALAAIATK